MSGSPCHPRLGLPPRVRARLAFLAVLRAGGQHVNTSDSQVELRFDLAATEALPEVWKERALERLAARLVDGVITVRASEHRSQWRNRETAAVRLAALLAEATAPPPSRAGRPSIPRGINERRLREKKQRRTPSAAGPVGAGSTPRPRPSSHPPPCHIPLPHPSRH